MAQAIAAIFAANRNKPDSLSLEVAALRRKNLGFLQVDLVGNPKQGLTVLQDSVGDNQGGLELSTWKLSSSAEWLQRGLIATPDFLYVLSVHKKDSLENAEDESQANADKMSTSSKSVACMYGFVDRIPMEHIVSIGPISPASTRNLGHSVDGTPTIPVSLLKEELQEYLQMNDLEGSEEPRQWEIVSKSPEMRNAFRIVIRDGTNTSEGKRNPPGGPLDVFDIPKSTRPDDGMHHTTEDRWYASARKGLGNRCGIALFGSTDSGGIPQPPRPDKAIYFSTGSSEGCTDSEGAQTSGTTESETRDRWVHCIRQAALRAHWWALWRRRRDAAQGALRYVYASTPFQAAMVLAITANFCVSVVQVQVGQPCRPVRAAARTSPRASVAPIADPGSACRRWHR